VLTPEGDVEAYAGALRDMLLSEGVCRAMGRRAREFVLGERSLPRAAQSLDRLLATITA
jgi:hypothetical protein